MKVFVINLDRDIERMKAAEDQLRRLHVEFERISAVDGKELSIEEQKKSVNSFRWKCAVGRPFTLGEIGCALSHIALYHRVVEEKLPLACVLEDDVILDERFPKVLSDLMNLFDEKKPQVFLLSNHSDSQGQLGDGYIGYMTPANVYDTSLKRISGDMFAEGYVVTYEGAKALLKMNYPIITPCDWWTRWVKLGAIELYHAFPTVCRQNKHAYDSHTIVGMVKSTRALSLPRKIIHFTKRIFGITIDKILTILFGR
ncbi:MAG: glycosyltransferase family 25 protein [Lentisphaeria bacterium]|jgi:glycosyl transferase family 25